MNIHSDTLNVIDIPQWYVYAWKYWYPLWCTVFTWI